MMPESTVLLNRYWIKPKNLLRLKRVFLWYHFAMDIKKTTKILGGIGVVTVLAGLPYHTDVTTYEITSSKITHPRKILILADLHNARYGKNMSRLLKMINEINPDYIFMPGDMAEENYHQDNTILLFNQLKGRKMYYCTGNHEEYRWDIDELKERFKKTGVTVLDDKEVLLDDDIELAGISCRLKRDRKSAKEVAALFETERYRILLAHKPNWIELYKSIDTDLVICGHAHGGQVCIPFTKIGLAAPSQGLMPKYTNGIHDLGNTKMLISRGLVRHYHGIPRLYNNPELVVLNLLPEKKNQ